jgi:leader peptidase (prepilin peptidase) / N-methyltransferase
MFRVFGTVIAALAGLAFGSFLNVCVSRWPESLSIVKPRSYCPGCGRTLAWWENIPLASWIALGGRCRTCRAWIGWRHLLVELALGALWACEGWRFFGRALEPGIIPYDFHSAFAKAISDTVLEWLLIALAVLDLENLWLPDWITYPGIALGVVYGQVVAILDSPAWYLKESWRVALEKSAFEIAVSAGIILLIRFVYWLIRRREGMGLGDVKLMAMLAAWLGLTGVAISFAIGVVFGALVALVVIAAARMRAKSEDWAAQKLPLGTFLCLGGVVNILWGQQILDAYRRWARF